MEQSLSGILLSFLMIFVGLVKYWYVSIPVLVVLVVWYQKTSNKIVVNTLRIILSLIAISLLVGLVLFIWGR